ncbi:hypothetical protein GCM10023209_27020 [Roseibacterium beibuensis]|uniref:Uncharacterized protein n=1 Tax=[Roseibacterium] beibuensis TaxID=1193142 RepID=A0ABP9LF02_9RHOB
MPAHIGAAFVDKKFGEVLDPGMIDGTQDAAPLPLLADQPGRDELFQVMRQDRTGDAHILAQLPDRQARRAGANKAAQNGKARLGAECGEGRRGEGEV